MESSVAYGRATITVPVEVDGVLVGLGLGWVEFNMWVEFGCCWGNIPRRVLYLWRNIIVVATLLLSFL